MPNIDYKIRDFVQDIRRRKGDVPFLELNGKIDRNDLSHFMRLFHQSPIAVAPCPMKDGRIHPQTTRFLHRDGFHVTDIVHVKPIYYETLTGQWRPMSEVASGFGNHWINLREDWSRLMHPRYLKWLLKRMEFMGGSVNFPFPRIGLRKIREGQEIFFTVTTVYPDPDPETATVDGYVADEPGGAGVAWATLIANPGTDAFDSGSPSNVTRIWGGTTSNQFARLWRSIFLFDASSIPDGDDISAVIMSVKGTAKTDSLNATPDINVYSSAPASNTGLVAGDFDSLGSTAFATAITYANYSATAYNDFTFNATGRSNTSKTAVSKFGLRNANYDVAAVAPAWANNLASDFTAEYAEVAGTTSDPKLEVTHAAPGGGTPLFMLMGIGT